MCEHLVASCEHTEGKSALRIQTGRLPMPEQKGRPRSKEQTESIILARDVQFCCTRGVLSLSGIDVESRRQTPYIALRPACSKERVGGGKRLAKVSRRKESLERDSEPRRFLGGKRRLCRIACGERRFIAGFECCNIRSAVHQR